MRKVLLVALYVVIVSAIMLFAVLYATSPEVWYSGMHDSLHEGDNCRCYERLVEQDGK